MSLRREVHRAISVLEASTMTRGFEVYADRSSRAVKILKAALVGGSWQDPETIQRPSVVQTGSGGGTQGASKSAANKDAKRARWRKGDKRAAEREAQT